jgi:hypothetical protein
MPTLSATDGGVTQPLEQIKRVDITPEDIRTKTDEELHAILALLRNNRETAAPRAPRKAANGPRGKEAEPEIVDDGDMEQNI